MEFEHNMIDHNSRDLCRSLSTYIGLIFVALICISCSQSQCLEGATLYGKNKKEIICYTEDRVKHGPHTKWHEGGLLKAFERNYTRDTLDGTYRQWYSNGQPKLVISYKNGKLTGSYTRWFSNGQIHIKNQYINNVRTGAYLEFYKNGKPKIEFNYDALGRFEGDQIEYRITGFRMRQRTFLKGALIGKKFWRANGLPDPVVQHF